MRYYVLQVFINRYEGYYVTLSTDKNLEEEEILQLAREQELFREGEDWIKVSDIDEIDFKTYKEFLE